MLVDLSVVMILSLQYPVSSLYDARCWLESGGRVEITPVVEEEPHCQMGVGVGDGGSP